MNDLFSLDFYNHNFFGLQVCITQASALHAQKDFTVSIQDGPTKQDCAKKAISASRAQPGNRNKAAPLENIVQKALTYPKTVLLVPFLTQLVFGKQSNAPTAQLDHTALNQGGPTPQDHAGQDITAQLDPV